MAAAGCLRSSDAAASTAFLASRRAFLRARRAFWRWRARGSCGLPMIRRLLHHRFSSVTRNLSATFTRADNGSCEGTVPGISRKSAQGSRSRVRRRNKMRIGPTASRERRAKYRLGWQNFRPNHSDPARTFVRFRCIFAAVTRSSVYQSGRCFQFVTWMARRGRARASRLWPSKNEP